MNFSILIPTRNRPELLHGLLISIRGTVDDVGNVEVLVVYDDDDSLTEGIVKNEENWFSDIGVKFYKRSRSKNLSEDYINFLAKKARGKWLWILNDDCVVVNKDWDMYTKEILEGKGVVYGFIDDGMSNWFCSFPMLSREAYEKLGWFYDPRYPTNMADQFLFKVFEKTPYVVTVPVKVKHLCWQMGTRDMDEVGVELAMNCKYPSPLFGDVEEVRKRLG